MAKLLSYFNLCPIMDPKDFLGVAEGKEEGTIINTLGRNIIIIIKVCPEEFIPSWVLFLIPALPCSCTARNR